ncbi:hypothetical protein [Borrelia miyamotoi]|uniref:hypothetical protein n=1 Tax=Borrelia miyamotoi TaxID=47466 RepID=UPI001C756AF5|nr:hypothetical protein [Borrelia miyamotoi]BCR21296.1 hypothetical protein BmIO_00708 [Borrelia miyamotoi]
MKYDQNKVSGNDLRKNTKIPYWKRKRIKSDVKKQKAASLNTNDNKSVDTESGKNINHKVNSQKGFIKDRRSHVRIKEICPVCEKQIRYIASCMSMKVDGEDKPIHFDCAMDKLRSDNGLFQNESLVYGGVGKFFVVDKSVRGNNLAFKILKEIDFENLESHPSWRKKLFQNMNKGFKFY